MALNLKLRDGSAFELPESKPKALAVIADAIARGGVTDDGRRMDWDHFCDQLFVSTRDHVSTPDIHPLLSVSTQVLFRQPLDPIMEVTNLFTRITAKGLDHRVLLGAIGTVVADDVAEGEQFPEVMFQIGSGMETALVGKSGIQASFTKEALRYSTWDIWGMNLREMRAALVRHKEKKAVLFLRSQGVTLFDNAMPQTSVFGVTTGRGLDMLANGSLVMKDLMRAYAHMASEGFPPDTLVLHPSLFMIYMNDAVLRNLFMSGMGGAYFQRWSGNSGPLDAWSNGAMGAMGPSLGNKVMPGGSPSGEAASGIAGREHGMTSAPQIPGYFPFPFRIVVSPFMTFDDESELGDIILCRSGQVGLLLQDEEVVQDEWTDQSRDVLHVKLCERYVFAVSSEGQGIGVIRNVAAKDNYWDGTVKAYTLDVDTEIDPSTPVV